MTLFWKVYDSREGPYCLIYCCTKISYSVLHMYRGDFRGGEAPPDGKKEWLIREQQ
jgi:hypothetical protein